CGTANAPGVRFCGECGNRLDEPAGDDVTPASTRGAAALAAAEAPGQFAGTADRQTERRLVSVLFADLVGFTARSDGSDPEQVREFLSRYFDSAREVVGRYGGTIEKFIGDAVT